MGSKTCSSLVLFLTLNFLFFTLVSSAHDCGTGSRPNPNPRHSPSPTPSPSPSPEPNPNYSGGLCPRDALKLGVCGNVLNGLLLNVSLGEAPLTPCCSLFNGLVDLEAALCLCTALKANILGTNLDLPISLNLFLNACSRQVPRDYHCA